MYTLENYPNFFRVVPSESVFNAARLALLKEYKWTRVGTLYQTNPRYALPHSRLLTVLDTADIQIDEVQGIGEGDDIEHELEKLKEKDVRIILGNFDEFWARKVFCQAFKMGMYGRKYQWIIVAMYAERWWETPQPDVSCDPAQIVEAVEGYIGTDLLPLSTSENITVSGLTPTEYEAEYNLMRSGEYSRFHGYAYDGIWALALSIHAVIVRLRANDTRISEFDYRKASWGRLFKEALNDTNFIGVTVIKDYKLFMVVGVFLMLDVIILTTWQILDPFYREARRGQPVSGVFAVLFQVAGWINSACKRKEEQTLMTI
ncbi:hypothetical protein V5799_023037 [Amblyomma americanum]|uniref:Gamma-aminobutyric acid type B receptor subunit 2 n=1 Tax=Amblyomma americanum TaxID=6943 RepID=A0AAQ4FIS8_AMBAM